MARAAVSAKSCEKPWPCAARSRMRRASAAAVGGLFDIHFHGQAGAAFGELRGEFEFGGLAIGFLFQDFFDVGLRERREMKLQAARNDGGQQRVGRRRGQDERGGAGRLFENFQEDVGDVPAHGLRAIQDEDAAAAHGLEVGGALHGAKLADAQHGARDGAFQADGIGHQRPDVRMRLQDERHALDGGGVGAFAALGEALLDEAFADRRVARCAGRCRTRHRSRR